MSRTGFSGELGYELIPARDDAERLWLALADAGVRPVGFNAIDIARIEAGLIVFEFEYEPGQLTPFDLGMDRMVSFAPEIDYVGQGCPAEDRRRAAATPQDTAAGGGRAARSRIARSPRTGRVVGTLTSPTNSPRFGPIALAIMDTAAADNETVVAVGGPPPPSQTCRSSTRRRSSPAPDLSTPSDSHPDPATPAPSVPRTSSNRVSS